MGLGKEGERERCAFMFLFFILTWPGAPSSVNAYLLILFYLVPSVNSVVWLSHNWFNHSSINEHSGCLTSIINYNENKLRHSEVQSPFTRQSSSIDMKQLTITENLLWASLLARMVKNLPAVRETWVWSLGQEEPLEKEMITHSSILSWKIPWTEQPGGLQFMRSQSWTQLSN